MIGAIAGDIIGSCYEHHPVSSEAFTLFPAECRFTDDTVLTVAVAEWLLDGGELTSILHEYYDRYPDAGYGRRFRRWARMRERVGYDSFGNGSAMRVSPVAYAFETLEEVLGHARRSAEPTHDHPEGIRGAEAVATAIFLARQGTSKDDLREVITSRFGYDLDRPLEVIRRTYTFDSSCPGSVPESIIAFLESTDYESAVRHAIALGGDADTMASIAGAIAEAHYGGVPEAIEQAALARLDDRLTDRLERFTARYGRPRDAVRRSG